VTSRIEPVKVGESPDPEVNAILQSWRDGWWGDPSMFGGWAHIPALLKASMAVVEAFWPGQSEHNLTGHMPELVRIKTAHARGCAYCASVRTEAVRDITGPKEAEIAKFQPSAGEHLTEREALTICFAERMAIDPKTVDDEFFAKMKEHFSEDELVEIIIASGVVILGSGFVIALNIDSETQSFEYENVLAGVV
jgi:alkylhydroperoxidase family enzyme